jgi:hypothetical protein
MIRIGHWIVQAWTVYVLLLLPLPDSVAYAVALIMTAVWMVASAVGLPGARVSTLPAGCAPPPSLWSAYLIMCVYTGYFMLARANLVRSVLQVAALRDRLASATASAGTAAASLDAVMTHLFPPKLIAMAGVGAPAAWGTVPSLPSPEGGMAFLDPLLGGMGLLTWARRGDWHDEVAPRAAPAMPSLLEELHGAVLAIDMRTLRKLGHLLTPEASLAVAGSCSRAIDATVAAYGGQRIGGLGALSLTLFPQEEAGDGDGAAYGPPIHRALHALATVALQLSRSAHAAGVAVEVVGGVSHGAVLAGVLADTFVTYQAVGEPVTAAEALATRASTEPGCVYMTNDTLAALGANGGDGARLAAGLIGALRHTPVLLTAAGTSACTVGVPVAVVHSRVAQRSEDSDSDVDGAAGFDATLLGRAHPFTAAAAPVYSDFKLLYGLGSGHFATVYLALHRASRNAFAVKIVDLRVSRAKALQAELKALAAPPHPGLVRFVCALPGPAAEVWLVQELVTGRTLDAHLAASGPMEEHAVCAWLRQLASAVGHLHAHAIIHRDIKPANIMVTPAGDLKLLDLGLAAVVQRRADTGVTPPPARGPPTTMDVLRGLAPAALGTVHRQLLRPTFAGVSQPPVVPDGDTIRRCGLVGTALVVQVGGGTPDQTMVVPQLQSRGVATVLAPSVEQAALLLERDGLRSLDAVLLCLTPAAEVPEVHRLYTQSISMGLQPFVAAEGRPEERMGWTARLAGMGLPSCVGLPLSASVSGAIAAYASVRSGLTAASPDQVAAACATAASAAATDSEGRGASAGGQVGSQLYDLPSAAPAGRPVAATPVPAAASAAAPAARHREAFGSDVPITHALTDVVTSVAGECRSGA